NPELSRRRNIFDYTISSLKISDFQEIDGVPHGILTGRITGCLVKKEIKETNQDPPLSSETVIENYSTNTPYTIANRGCGNMAIPGVMPNGCRNIGCWSILSYLIWVPLLFSLFKFCDNSDQEDRNMPKVEDNKKDYWEENSEEDFGIDSTKILDNTYEIQYKSILLPNVQFFTNSDRILEYSKKELDELSLYFNENKELKGIIFGYTDAKGNKEKNQRLSQKRAEAVMNYLIERGVESSRLSAIGKGESDPRASNKLREGRLMNRRVEITIVKKVRRK
ncbi:MAG: OmpA family protein, partial [Bacteroidota bacterium]